MEKLICEYRRRYGIPEVTNSMGEIRKTDDSRIIFPNGWCASIIDSPGSSPRYSVAMCDYNGYFNFNALKKYGADDLGCINCETELELVIACEHIRRTDLITTDLRHSDTDELESVMPIMINSIRDGNSNWTPSPAIGIHLSQIDGRTVIMMTPETIDIE